MGKTMPYFSDWLNKTIVYKAKVSQSGAGDVIYASDGTTIPCYISGGTQIVINDKGEEVVSTEHLFFDATTTGVSTIDFTGIIVLNSKNRPIKSIENFYDEDGDLDLVVVNL